jgi:TonB family protein
MSAKDPLHIPWAFSLSQAPRLPLTGEQHPLRRESWKWVSWGNLVTLLLSVLLFTGWYIWSQRQPAEPVARQIRIVRYTDLGVPPSIAKPSVPQIKIQEAVAQAVAPPSIGIPEPVADELAQSPTIATVAQMAEALAPITMSDLGGGAGDSLVVEIDVDRTPSPTDFVAVEEEPVRISIDPPVYPEMAQSAGIEGTVLVRVLVAKDGKVRKVMVIDGPDLLKDAAIDCAKTAIFRPALQHHRPIEVWVMMPITFRLH